MCNYSVLGIIKKSEVIIMNYERQVFIDDLEEMDRESLEDVAYDYDVDYESDYTDEELKEAIIAAYDKIYGDY